MRRTGSTIAVAMVLSTTACNRPTTSAAGATPSGSAAPTTPAPPTAPATTATALPPTTAPPPPPTTAAPPPPPPTTTPPPPPPPPPPAPAVLRPGDRGPEVAALQQQLKSLGYWLPDPDGVYGAGTRHAVVAAQKASGIARDGTAGPVTRQALDRNERVRPRTTAGHAVEVDLGRQLVIIADGGHASLVLDSSTGAEPGSTPAGRYRVFRHVDGMDTGPYGPLYRPKYFNQGIAVHGYDPVPPTPASHGCVRVTNDAINMLWSTATMPIGTTVIVY